MVWSTVVDAVLQIWVDNPTKDNYIALPDSSGVFVVEALAPLYINGSGSISLDQSQIVQVGQLVAGSIGRTFGMLYYYTSDLFGNRLMQVISLVSCQQSCLQLSWHGECINQPPNPVS